MEKSTNFNDFALPHSHQIMGSIVQAFKLEDDFLTGSTSSRFFNGESVNSHDIKEIYLAFGKAQLHFWHGRFTPNLQLVPPPTLPFKQGLTETDIIITIENEVVLYLQAKLHSGSSPLVKNQPDWDQVIRTLDVGSWYAQGRFSSSYFVFLQYGEDNTNTESMVLKYKDNPIATKNALAHRCDLDEKQKELLSRSMAFIRWPDPFDGIN